MTLEQSAVPNLPASFRFRGFVALCVVLVAILALVLALGIVWIERQGLIGGLTFLAAGFLLFGGLGAITMLGMSDIVIDDQKIARRIFGIEWQALPWNCVERIRIFRIPDFGRFRKVRAFKVYAFQGENNGRIGHRRISFNEQSTDLTDMLRVMNVFIAKYSIKIEMDIGGTMQAVGQIPLSNCARAA